MKTKRNHRFLFGQQIQFSKEIDRQYHLWLGVKNSAKRRGLEFSISPTDLVIPELCPILGIRLNFRYGKGSWSDQPSVDRIDNDKGYITNNVQVISRQANSMKSNATDKELLKFAFWIYKNYLKKG